MDETNDKELTVIGNSQSAKDLREMAKSLFFNNQLLPTQIAATLDIPIEELRTLVYGRVESDWQLNKSCWAYKKQFAPANNPRSFQMIQPILLKHSKSKALNMMMDGMNQIREKMDDPDNPLQLSIDDINRLTDVFAKIDKIDRLEDGRSTENLAIEEKQWSLQDLINSKEEEEAEAIETTATEVESDDEK